MSSSDDSALPDRMFRNGRKLDQKFDAKEKLFQRFSKLSSLKGAIYPNSIRFPDFSVNREKFSEPLDVLLHDYPNLLKLGVASFKVKDLPGPQKTGDKKKKTTYCFKAEHVPLDDNYAHSEVRVYKNGKYSTKTNVAKTIKTKFRIHLANCIKIEKEVEN
ncbi:MAG: hypothetical protein WEA56_07620 [Balneolaceae bacterium]